MEAPLRLRLTPAARALLAAIAAEAPDACLVLDDTGCCGASPVFLRRGPPGPPYEPLGAVAGLEAYVHPAFRPTLEGREAIVDVYAVEVDDSFSLEVRRGRRLALRLPRGRGPPA
jgi:uncharacterized protein (DUF779 family)